MKIHLLGMCGMGMGSLAGLLQEAGHQVTGCDRACLPPMSDSLAAWGLQVQPGFDPAHMDEQPDLVVVGNVCRADNPEVARARALELPLASFPETLAREFLTRRLPVVVAGTHGKTTTTCLLAYLLEAGGCEPSFLAGGLRLDSGRSFGLGSGEVFVVEGDEYDSAFFDKQPKFMHYRPRLLLLTSLEYDHADIYPDPESYRAAFAALLETLPADGCLIACADHEPVVELARAAPCPVQWYGLEPGPGWRAARVEFKPTATSFDLVHDGRSLGRLHSALAGRHNLANTLAALAACAWLGLEPNRLAGALAGFAGVARRQQVRGQAAGVTVIDDFAHHPTEVAETLAALRGRYPGRRLVALFEPRTNTSRRNIFQELYPRALAGADLAVVVPPYRPEQIDPGRRFDSGRLVAELRAAGHRAELAASATAAVELLAGRLAAGDVVVVMSNGAFDGVHEKLLQTLRGREGR